MPRALIHSILFILFVPALAQQPTPTPAKPKPPAPKPWLEMDYGPTISTTIESAYPARNITQKGIAIRLDAKSQTYVLFDEDLFRYSLAWTGGFTDWRGVLFDGAHRVWPSAVGQPIFGTSLAPGWAKAGSFDDPRARYKSTEYTKESDEWKNRPYGPLPHDHAQYKGLYLHGQQVILAYTVAGTYVLDSPGLERAGETPVITRTLNVAKSSADLDMVILEHPAKSTVADAAPSKSTTLAILGDVKPAPAVVAEPETAKASPQPSAAQDARAVAVAITGAPESVTWRVANGTQLRLHIPAAATPLRFKILTARVDAGTLPAFTAAAQSSAAPQDLSTLTQGGPARYPEKLTTVGVLAKTPENGPNADKPYVTDNLTAPVNNPWKSRMRFGGFDFFPDGRSAAISTWDGDVWLVTGIDDKLEHLTWQRIATGLYQPLGVKILPDRRYANRHSPPAIFVLCRDQIVRLHDLNGDGETDFYECFNNDAQVTEHFHEFAMGLQTDADGNFYYAKSARHALDAVVPQHGTLIKVSADGTKSEILANGFRAANGVGIGPDNQFAATDQEGFYTPANRINLILPTPDGKLPFFGNLWSYQPTPRTMKDGYDPPLCWLPVNVDRSPAEDLWVTSDKWGPLKGRMIHTSYGTGKLFLVPYEIVGGVPQGGAVAFPDIAFRTGIMRARFNPVDGQLYLCGLVGWATNMTEPGGFHRVRYTGKPLNMPTGLHVAKDGVAIIFTDALAKTVAQDVGSYAVQQWNYRWTSSYGSKHYSVADPNKTGADDVEITAAALSADGKTVTLTIPNLKPVMQMKIQVNLKSADGAPVKHTIHNTINKVP